MKIFKYEFPVENAFTLQLPMLAEILSVQSQKDKACIWALVDEKNTTEERDFMVFGTGHEVYEPISGELKYVATFQLYEGGFVGHLFEHIR